MIKLDSLYNYLAATYNEQFIHSTMGLRYSTWVLIWISFPFPRLLSVGHGKEGTFHNCIAKSSLQAGTSITISRQIDSHIASWWEQQQHALSRVQRSGGLSVEGAALAVILMETDGPPHSGDDPGHNLPSHTAWWSPLAGHSLLAAPWRPGAA